MQWTVLYRAKSPLKLVLNCLRQRLDVDHRPVFWFGSRGNKMAPYQEPDLWIHLKEPDLKTDSFANRPTSGGRWMVVTDLNPSPRWLFHRGSSINNTEPHCWFFKIFWDGGDSRRDSWVPLTHRFRTVRIEKVLLRTSVSHLFQCRPLRKHIHLFGMVKFCVTLSWPDTEPVP